LSDTLAEKRKAQLAKQKPPTGSGKRPAKGKAPVAGPPPAPALPLPVKRYAPPPELKGNCGSCGSLLHYIPVNRRVKAIACTKSGCALYRQRLKTVVLKEIKEVADAKGNNSRSKD